MKLLRNNAPLALFGFNVALVLLLLLQATFAGGGYDSAAPLLDLGPSDVTELEIRDPRGGLTVILKRGAELPPEENAPAEGDFDPRKAYDRMRDSFNRPKRFAWDLRIQERVATGDEGRTTTRERQYRADPERVAELFKTLGEARRYYSVNRTPEKDRELQMGKNDRGRYDAPALVFRLESGKETILYLGRARVGADESYVRIGEDDRIYLVETDLRSAVGEGQPLFFRDRSVWPERLTADGIIALAADFPGQKNDVELARGPDGTWRLSAPETGPARANEIASLLNDLVELKADDFENERPDDIEEDTAFDLEIEYKDSMTGTPRPLRLEVLGKKDYSSYYVRRQAGADEERPPLVRVTSVYLGDFYEPDRKLLDRTPPGGGVPGAVPSIPLE